MTAQLHNWDNLKLLVKTHCCPEATAGSPRQPYATEKQNYWLRFQQITGKPVDELKKTLTKGR